MQRVSGPYRGYFVAAYTVAANGGFVGYGKACVERPDKGTWAEGPAQVASGVYGNELHALTAVEHKVRLEIEQLPPNWAPFTVPGTLVGDDPR